MRIGLADDDAMVRRSLQAQFSQLPEVEVAWAVANGAEVLQRYTDPDTDPKDLPQVVLMDLNMPVMGGAAATRELMKLPSAPVVVVFSSLGGINDIREAITAGASGYFMKEDDPALIVEHLYRALSGEVVFSPQCSAELARSLVEQSVRCQADKDLGWVAGVLTERETEVLRSIADGKSNQQIAKQLGITEGTVKTHVKVILHKLGAGDRAGAVVVAFRAGILW